MCHTIYFPLMITLQVLSHKILSFGPGKRRQQYFYSLQSGVLVLLFPECSFTDISVFLHRCLSDDLMMLHARKVAAFAYFAPLHCVAGVTLEDWSGDHLWSYPNSWKYKRAFQPMGWRSLLLTPAYIVRQGVVAMPRGVRLLRWRRKTVLLFISE